MKKERLYFAYMDNGHDFYDFYYHSTHRNKSAANIQDLINQLPRHRKHDKIKYTYLTDPTY